jgi:Sulfotransferase family
VYKYSSAEKLLHRIVLKSSLIQEHSFRLQKLALPKNPVVRRPVFILGMPRSGTTILVNLLIQSGVFQTSRFSDIPFPLFPRLWRPLYNLVKGNQGSVERLHQDGIQINSNSPESCEEIFWQNVCKNLSIEDTVHEFKCYMAAVIGPSESRRYVSKNNNNISRIDVIQEVCNRFEGRIVIPIRDPLKVATSSLRLHLKFSEIQKQDPFVREYMDMLGHNEFGEGLKWQKIGETAFNPSASSTTLECWLKYWIYLHTYLSKMRTANIVFLDFDHFRMEPRGGLEWLSDRLSSDNLLESGLNLVKPELVESELSFTCGDREVVKVARELKQSLVSLELGR